jgi:hypothetical protein
LTPINTDSEVGRLRDESNDIQGKRLTVEVLTYNTAAVAFWRAVDTKNII